SGLRRNGQPVVPEHLSEVRAAQVGQVIVGFLGILGVAENHNAFAAYHSGAVAVLRGQGSHAEGILELRVFQEGAQVPGAVDDHSGDAGGEPVHAGGGSLQGNALIVLHHSLPELQGLHALGGVEDGLGAVLVEEFAAVLHRKGSQFQV